MNGKISIMMVIALSFVVFVIGCDTTQQDWEIARSADTIPAYEEFLQKHPQGALVDQACMRLEELYAEKDWKIAIETDTISAYEEFLRKHPQGALADQARTRLEKLYVQRDWKITKEADTIPAYEEFIKKHPQGEFADQARIRLDELYVQRDWERALKVNTIKGYADFLKLHPNSPFTEKAKGKIVDIEVSEIMQGEHGQLPPSDKISDSPGRTYSVVNVHNDTRYNLTIRYSGPESFKVIFSPGEKASIEVLRGNYKVAASVDAAHVQNYAGEETLDGGNYEGEYYIAPPYKIVTKTFGEFEPWPTKRRMPKHLK